jgi:hypothetical protein
MLEINAGAVRACARCRGGCLAGVPLNANPEGRVVAVEDLRRVPSELLVWSAGGYRHLLGL